MCVRVVLIKRRRQGNVIKLSGWTLAINRGPALEGTHDGHENNKKKKKKRKKKREKEIDRQVETINVGQSVLGYFMVCNKAGKKRRGGGLERRFFLCCASNDGLLPSREEVTCVLLAITKK